MTDKKKIMHLILFIIPLLEIYRGIIKAEQRFKSEYEGHLIMYCCMRTTIVCPKCYSAFQVSDLEEQMNTKWECTECGCTFEETPTHTMKGK